MIRYGTAKLNGVEVKNHENHIQFTGPPPLNVAVPSMDAPLILEYLYN